MVESLWLWGWYSRIKHQYNREQNQGLQLNPGLCCSSSPTTAADRLCLETFCSQVPLRAEYLGHKTELPAPQPFILYICRGYHTFLGLTKASPGQQCLAARASSQPCRGCQSFVLQHQDKGRPRGASVCQNLCSISMVQSPCPNCHIPEQPDFQVFSSQPSLLCTSSWPITLSYSAKVSNNTQKITKLTSPPGCPASWFPIFWTSHPCLFKWVINVPDFSR